MDLKKLSLRTVSGLVYCLLIVGCTLWGSYGILFLGALFSTIACIEFAKISKELTQKNIPTLILDIAGCICLCLGYEIYPLAIWAVVMIARFIEELYINSQTPLRNLAHSFMSQIWIGIPMGIMVSLGFLADPRIVLMIFILIWINDTGAFLTGCSIGKHKLFERISPKKTWEGFFGGMVFCIIGVLIFFVCCNDFFRMSGLSNNPWYWVGLSLAVTIFGTWGDLVESMIKRSLHIKDSGNIIPGHGGILDRIDSLLLAFPASAIYLLLMAL